MRYLPLTKQNRTDMLQQIGATSVDELFRDVPQKAFRKELANIPLHMGELEIERKLSAYSNENHHAGKGPFFLGAGCYYHHIPSSVDYIIQRSEFLTAYTPYQPEIAQGTLQVIYEYQTMIAQLTGQDIANASMYDGATSMAEAALMAQRITKRSKVVIGGKVHPQYVEVLKSYTKDVVERNFENAAVDDAACIIIQSPDFTGQPQDYADWRTICDKTGAMLIVVINEIVSLGLLEAPTVADIVCGEAQSIGLPMSFGGPHLGFFACKEKYLRQMPGRLCGETVDADGKRGFVLTLSTREQHIRREKATSNICTNQGLCALAFTVHLALLGENGLKQLALLNHEKACELADAVANVRGITLPNETFFNEFLVQFSHEIDAQKVAEKLAAQGIIAGLPIENGLIVAATEMTTADDIAKFCAALQEQLA